MDAAGFLRFVFGDDAPVHLSLWVRQNKKALLLPANNLEGAGKLAQELAKTYDVYFVCRCKIKPQPLPSGAQRTPTKRESQPLAATARRR